MASLKRNSSLLPFVFILALLFPASSASRRLTAAEQNQTLTITYHRGAVLSGPISLNLMWYGNFTASHRSIISDFIVSLYAAGDLNPEPSVSSWWRMTEKYYSGSKSPPPHLTLGEQTLDQSCSLGKSLKNADLAALAAKPPQHRAINVVLTADDVAVEGFCMSRCATHGSSAFRSESGRFVYIWGPPLIAPNGNVGVDGMVMNLASMIAGSVTNPFGGGYFMGPKTAPLEAATACPGVYGKGAYPGYAGELLVDPATGASYNANGAHGRKYLLPAIFDPTTASCSTLV
ncbi:hypothetical protein KSP40_PGU012333 [Platanthera guangdongensis]|uniref:Protein EXORDIUM-like n=1 Tax=Platanthera guangdongensis TaxID=2320717 RepID=A0ABR2MZJ8_9ASPA